MSLEDAAMHDDEGEATTATLNQKSPDLLVILECSFDFERPFDIATLTCCGRSSEVD